MLDKLQQIEIDILTEKEKVKNCSSNLKKYIESVCKLLNEEQVLQDKNKKIVEEEQL